MTVSEALVILRQNIPEIGDKEYDGIIVKKLEASNTLDDGRTTNQTHIAITGAQMDIFPYLRADGYFNCDYAEKDDSLKKYFVEQVPFRLYKSNLERLGGEFNAESFEFNADGFIKVMVSIVRSRRKGATDQVQLSMTTLDDAAFVDFRKIVHTGDYIVILKHKERLEYDCYALRNDSEEADHIAGMNNKFFNSPGNTKVRTDDLIVIKDEEEIQSDYSLEELGQILKTMYDNAPSDMQTTAIHAFGIKFGEAIKKGKYSIKDITVAAGIPESYQVEIGKGTRLYKSFVDNYFGMTMWGKNGRYSNEPEGIRCTGGDNILIYGVPGAGKSHYIQNYYCNDKKRMERVVFHPDYTYSDFVGQILPRVTRGQLKYIFTPGPFTKALKDAWWDPEHMYYLVIEEINRGNAPAIFGEIFQLLDRKTQDAYPVEEVGESEYAIVNFDIAEEVYGDKNRKIVLPSNLTILATMNTSDQNVFTLDTAFQRRWIMKYIDNDISAAKHSEELIEGTNVSWGAFASVVNDLILEEGSNTGSSEDKRLGAYFANRRELKLDRFPEKVIKYLWDDAFKMDRDMIFTDKARSLEYVIESYKKTGEDRLEAILRGDVYNRMIDEMRRTQIIADPSEKTDEEEER